MVHLADHLFILPISRIQLSLYFGLYFLNNDLFGIIEISSEISLYSQRKSHSIIVKQLTKVTDENSSIILFVIFNIFSS
jgi:hypothetical protein